MKKPREASIRTRLRALWRKLRGPAQPMRLPDEIVPIHFESDKHTPGEPCPNGRELDGVEIRSWRR